MAQAAKGMRVFFRGLIRVALTALLSLAGPLGVGLQSAYAASYLDGEVTYTGTVAQSNYRDASDGSIDDICHDGEGGEGAVVSCDMRGDDDYSKPIDIGFNFDYYGVTYSQLTANINGTLNFDCPSNEYDNEALPTTFDGDCIDGDPGIVPTAMLPFWDDIITAPKELTCAEYDEFENCMHYNWNDNYATIMYKTIGSPGSRKFIMQWTDMYLYDAPNVPLGTFQVILYEGSNNFQFQYRNLLGDPDRSSGSSATIGIQSNLSLYSQYSYEASTPISEGTAILYTPTGDGDYNPANDEATYLPVFLNAVGVPEQPVLTRPNDEATGVARRPVLKWNAASGAVTYTVTVATDPAFSDIVTQGSTAQTQFTSRRVLDPNTQYYWSVKAENEIGQRFSDVRSFTTGTQIVDSQADPSSNVDEDHIPDIYEDGSPNDGDANDDGLFDAEQAHVVSFPNGQYSNEYVAVQIDDACTLTGAESEAEASQTDKDIAFQYNAGLINYVADCGTPGYVATVTLYQYGATTEGVVLRKYNPDTHAYSTVEDAVIEQVTIGGKQVVKATYSVTDGGALDTDGVEDGIIHDPVGLASVSLSAPATGVARR